jgi:hypothetical protein
MRRAGCPTLILLLITVIAASTVAALAADLPLSRVVMFSSGVGYFERGGAVEGTQQIQLSFKTEQINDLLKSLVLQDFDGGKIAPVIYAPREPLTRTLQSFGVDLSEDKSLADLLRTLRGAKVAIVADGEMQGQIVGVEKQQRTSGKDVVTFDVVNVLTQAGLQQVPIWHIKSLRLLDDKLGGDLMKALGVLNASHDSGKRPVTLTFAGQGKRRVRVGYLLETPVWKTSYRLVADEKGLFLQGWAIVENTTDDDWQNVKLSLVSGRPISFIQDLYQPLYVPRPVVAPSVIGSPPPQTYEGNMQAPTPPMATTAAPGAGARALPKAAARAARRDEAERMELPEGVAAGDAVAYEPQNALVIRGAQEAVTAQGEQVGELFQYAIDQPVSIARQRSAMIPIINKDIEGTKVSVYNQAVNAKFPLNGMKLKNSTALHLMGGPITVFDGGVYGGDALITDIAPGDERLITYAVDLGVEVAPKADDGTEEITALKIERGVLLLTKKQRTEVTYTAKNVTAEMRTLLIEHPIRDGWDLVAPAKADETTRNAYRFKLEIAPKDTAKLTVVEEHPEVETVALVDGDLDSIGLYMKSTRISESVKAALAKVVDMRGKLADLQSQRTEREARLKEIGDEQDRIRKNMAQLDRTNELYKTYVEKLTAQETEFEKLQGEIKKINADEKAQKNQINTYLEGLNVE